MSGANTVAVGIDVVEVDRIRQALERTPGLSERCFTDNELAYCHRARDPAERLAARWAAKEAAIKCLGGGVPGLDLRHVEVVRHDDGSPALRLQGEPAQRATDRGINSWLISMSHTATTAQAIVIGLS